MNVGRSTKVAQGRPVSHRARRTRSATRSGSTHKRDCDALLAMPSVDTSDRERIIQKYKGGTPGSAARTTPFFIESYLALLSYAMQRSFLPIL
jgi:hypothetical protein